MYEKCDPELRPSVAQLDSSERRKKQWRDYVAQTTGIDRALGMVLDKLKEKKLERDTIVVYTTDHGDVLGAYGWHASAKIIPHDSSTRVPFLLRYPGVLKPRRSSLIMGPLDQMPTLLGLMGIPVPASCQGRDLSKAIAAGDDGATDAVPLMMCAGGANEYRGVITRDWTFTAQRHDSPVNPLMDVLFDRREDPQQLRNRFTDNVRVRRQMMKLTRHWMERFADPFVSARELRSSAIEWRYPETGSATNRTSPLEWVKQPKLQPAKFRDE